MTQEGKINIDIILQYGDCILLQSKNGFLQSQGFSKPGIFLQLGSMTDHDRLLYRNMRDLVFQVVPRLRYEAFKEYNTFRIKHEARQAQKKTAGSDVGEIDAGGAADELRMVQLTKKLEEELKENQSILKRRIGEQVEYGQEIELVHYDSGMLLEASKTVAEFDKQCNLLKLVEQGSKSVCYYIEPRYKYRSMGQKVTYGDVISFRNIKTDLYIHFSEREVIWEENRKTIYDDTKFKNVVPADIDFRMPPNMFSPLYEVNFSSSKSKFTLLPFRNFENVYETSTIKGGQVIRLQHSESGANVSSDDQDFTNDGLAEVFLWHYKGKSNDIESITTNSLFEIEIAQDELSNEGQSATYSGNVSNIMTQSQAGMLFRMRHLNSGRLVVTQDYSHQDQQIKTVGLAEHYPTAAKVTREEGKFDKVDMHLTPEQQGLAAKTATDSLFRLVSTGVNVDNRIKVATAVQIQHYDSKLFLSLDNIKFTDSQKPEAAPEEEKIAKSQKKKEEKTSQELSIDQIRRASVLLKQKTRALVQSAVVSFSPVKKHKTVEEEASALAFRHQQTQFIGTVTEVGDEIDTTLYKAEPDGNLNQGSREVLSFSKQPSFENAFFIYPEQENMLKQVLQVHVSVNLMNSYLAEIASPDLGVSKERVTKIMHVLIDLTVWLEEEKDFITPDEQVMLDAPYSLKANEVIAGRKRRVQEKQRLVRELRVIESCIQILHVPFAKKAFNYAEITQESALTSICKLTYKLLAGIVNNFQLNQLYAAQWTTLYLKHVMNMTEQNQIGALQFLTMLSDQNMMILEKKFDRQNINKFICESKRSLQTPELMRLLTALCSCQGTPIITNQTDIIQILFTEIKENRDKFIILIRRTRGGDIEICLDLQKGRYVNLLTVVQQVTKVRQDIENQKDMSHSSRQLLAEYQSFIQMIDLLSEAALGRNSVAQQIIAENFELKTIQPVIENDKLPFELRHRFLRLFLKLYLDKTFQQLVVPSETVIWNQHHNLSERGDELISKIESGELNYPFKTTRGHISRAFQRMKDFCEEYLDKLRGNMQLDNSDQVSMTQQVLEVVLFMLQHGFYQDQDALNKVAKPIVDILDGTTDTIRVNGRDVAIGLKRYFPNAALENSVLAKRLACDILIQITRLENDQKCSIILSKLKYDIDSQAQKSQKILVQKQDEVEGGKEDAAEEEKERHDCSLEFNSHVLNCLTKRKGFESQDEDRYVCILFDLLLFRYPMLSQKVFELLCVYFLRTRTCLDSLANVKILESSKSIHTLNLIRDFFSQLNKLQDETSFWLNKSNEYGQQRKEDAAQIFKKLEQLCARGLTDNVLGGDKSFISSPGIDQSQMEHSEDMFSKEQKKLRDEYILFDMEPVVANVENQKLIRDFKLQQVALYIIKQRVDRITINNPKYIELITACYGFLVGYVRDNPTNQVQLYEDLDVIIRDSDKYQKATLLVYHIFRNNKKFLTLNVTKFLRQIVSYSEERLLDSSKKATYLKLLEVFCLYEDRLITLNSAEIITQFTIDPARSNVLYLLQPEGAKELYTILADCMVDHEIEDGEAEELLYDKGEMEGKQRSKVGLKKSDDQQEQRPVKLIMNVAIFNVIQLMQLVTMCCQGKSEKAETYSKQFILSLRVCANLLVQAENYWPLKIAVLKYVVEALMDTSASSFLDNKKSNEEDEAEDADDGDEQVETELQTFFRIVESMNADFEKYLNDEIEDKELHLPTGKTESMHDIALEYIFDAGVNFMLKTMQKKPTDIGSFDMKFFDIGKNLATLYYKSNKRRHKLRLFELLSYMQQSENCCRYLSDVKHPAKKLKNNEELQKLQNEEDSDEEGEALRLRAEASQLITSHGGLSKSSLCAMRIGEMCNSEECKASREMQFENMVQFVVHADQRVKQLDLTGPQSQMFANVRFAPLLSALLSLLDSQRLAHEHQLMGIKLIRKIVEVEHHESVAPAADWDSDEWIQFKRMIQVKQDYLVERGCVPFLCKLISHSTDVAVCEEATLVCITLILGGNMVSQNAFIDFMLQEDSRNKFLLCIKGLLVKFNALTKKYLTEKNAKLEMIHQFRKQVEMKKQRQAANIALGVVDMDEGEDNEELECDISIDEDDKEEEEDTGAKSAEQQQESQHASNHHADETKNLCSLIRLLRFLQLLCEGHHSGLQNHLREQKTKDGVKSPYSFDFVAYCSVMLGIYVKSYVNCYSTVLGNQLIEALVEFVQGPCRANQKTLVDTKVIDCCRDLLSQGDENEDDMAIRGFTGSKKSLLDELKMNAVKLLLSMIEGTVDEKIYEKVSSSLGDFQVILQRMETLYTEFITEELQLPANSSRERVQNSLKSDSFDGQISEGFDIYDLLNQLGDVIKRDRERLISIENGNQAYSFFKKNMGRIEVNMEGDIQIVFFIIQPKCRFLTEKTKQRFLITVERGTQQDKILGILQAVPGFIDEMDHLEQMTRKIIKLTPQVVFKIRDLSTILAVGIAFVIVWQYRYEKVLRPDGAYLYKAYIPPYYEFIIKVFGMCQLVSSSFLLFGFFINQKNLVIKAGWRARIEKNQLTLQGETRQIQRMRESSMSNIRVQDLNLSQARMFLSIEGPYSQVFMTDENNFNFYYNAVKFEYYWVSLSTLINNSAFVFAIQYLALSCQGLFQSPVFYAFHLLDVIERFPTLKDVIRSVTMNITQLLMTAMLGLILIYNYGVIAFMFIPDLYFDEGIDRGLLNKAGDSICMSLLHCFLSTFNYGLRAGGGIGEFLPAETAAEYNQQAYNIRFFFDVSFFLLVITILLNVIFGIIIDTFAALREKSQMQSEDMKNICYICGLNRQTLDRDTEEGFETHVLEDHLLWNYVYFLIHLQIKDESDMNGVESYIMEKFKMQETSWFPMHRCLRIIKEQRKRTETTSETNAVVELQKQLLQKFQIAEEGLKNLEAILT